MPKGKKVAQSGRQYAAAQRKASGAAAHSSDSTRLQSLAKLLARKEAKGATDDETMRCRMQLAEGYLNEREDLCFLGLLTALLCLYGSFGTTLLFLHLRPRDCQKWTESPRCPSFAAVCMIALASVSRIACCWRALSKSAS